MRVLLTGGGTGGHLSIVRAVKEELVKRGAEVYYIGSVSGQDMAWFGGDGDFEEKLFLKSAGVVNKRGVAKAASIFQLLKSAREARSFMKSRDIEALLSVGGYSAAPAAFAALTLGTPLYIHEQNAVSGRLNRLLKPFAKRFFTSYGETLVDYPVSEVFFESARVRSGVKRVIFLGGSQGARAINDFALSVAPELAGMGVSIIHQTGGADFERVKKGYEEAGIEADVFDFTEKLHEKIASADFAVSRAGAGTLWELAANRIPALFVPYPYAAGDHQYKNALFLKSRSACWLVRESELSPEMLPEIIGSDIRGVSERLSDAIKPGGAAAIAESLLGKR
ncbi:UDP-N-acetylglucosamine--N-acetylmuramyl-(pentapeptide) pyrophosphoryl-undecaprenol N-acetylglucosamine transferase [Hydrogenimonas sp.]|nr:UDP-N-acetylglucosamine--N-acetylmuramyl-(pentapeptide) pyrophosphoryl-undecaprenol N-acetylglucosamine transferase [Hydrogenimonas sp.]